MKKSIFAVLMIIIIIFAFVVSSWMLLNIKNSELEYVEGFDKDDLTVPTVLAIDPNPFDPQPPSTSSTRPDDFITPILLTNMSLEAIYPIYGGVIEVSIKNEDLDNDIFVYEFGINPDWAPQNKWYSTECGVMIEADQREELGLISFPGPLQEGDYSYNLRIKILIKHENNDAENESWYDWGKLDYEKHWIKIQPTPDLGTSQSIERHHNLENFFEEINDIIDPYSPEIRNLAVSIARNYSGNYNIYQVCAIFDWLRENIAYVGDPSGSKNYWATPSETVEACGGDCEDHATLLASLIMAIGGTTRMYMTDTHAFTTIFIGEDEDTRDTILAAIEKYYGTELHFAWIQDELGYWLVADSGSSFYIGGLPVNSIPTSVSSDSETFSFSFIEISKLYSVDIVPT